jgi:hypothetical protein
MWQHGLDLPYSRAHLAQTFVTGDQSSALRNPIFHGHINPRLRSPYERPPPNAPINIGTIDGTSNLETIVFKCSAQSCKDLKFSRWQEFRRHYNGAHMEGDVF